MIFRRLIDLFFLLLIFEGAIRRYIFPELSVPLQIFRDVLPSLALVYFLSGRRSLSEGSWPDGITGASLFIYVAMVVLQVLNPALPLYLIGALGIRTHLAYLPLLIMAPAYVRTRAEILPRLNALAIISIPVAALGVLQSTLPPTHFLNSNTDLATFGATESIRASGTFAYITGFSVFCQVSAVVAVAILFLTPMKTKIGALASVALFASIGGCLASGSRSAVYGAVLQILLFSAIVILRRSGRETNGFLSKIFWAAIFGLAALGSQLTTLLDQFTQRVQIANDDVGSRIWASYLGWTEVAFNSPLGSGVGTAHQQAGAFLGVEAGFLSGHEEEYSRVAWELGLFGIVALLIFKSSILIRIALCITRRNGPVSTAVLALCLSTLLFLIGGGVYTPISNALCYFCSGLGLGLCRWSPTKYRRQFQFGTAGT